MVTESFRMSRWSKLDKTLSYGQLASLCFVLVRLFWQRFVVSQQRVVLPR
jgi:hypothetical protein